PEVEPRGVGADLQVRPGPRIRAASDPSCGTIRRADGASPNGPSAAELVSTGADMRTRVALAVLLAALAAGVAAAQGPSSTHDRGSSLQAWQNPGLPAVLAKCKNPPPLNKQRLEQVAAANRDPANAAPPPEWA